MLKKENGLFYIKLNNLQTKKGNVNYSAFYYKC